MWCGRLLTSLFHIPLSVSWQELRQSGKGGPKNLTDLSQRFRLPSPIWESWTKVQALRKAHLAKVLVLVSWVTGVPTPSSHVPPSFYSIQYPGERRSSADIPNPHLHWHSAQRPWKRRYWYKAPHALALCSALFLLTTKNSLSSFGRCFYVSRGGRQQSAQQDLKLRLQRHCFTWPWFWN